MYMERDLRKATPLKENPNQSAHLSQCLDLLIVYLSNTAPMILGTHTHTHIPSLLLFMIYILLQQE